MIDLKNYKILKFTYPFSTSELGDRIWDKMDANESKWAVKLTLDGINDTGDLEDGSYDIFFLEDKLQSKIENILNKYDIPFVTTDETHLLLDNSHLLDEGLIEKLIVYLDENLTIDDVLDRISEVGLQNITPFEKYYLDRHKDD